MIVLSTENIKYSCLALSKSQDETLGFIFNIEPRPAYFGVRSFANGQCSTENELTSQGVTDAPNALHNVKRRQR